MPSRVVALDVVALLADIVASRTSRDQFAALSARLLAFRLGIEIAWVKFSVDGAALVHEQGNGTTVDRGGSQNHSARDL